MSILTEQKIDSKPKAYDNPVGIEFGLKEYVILSTGEAIPNPKYYRQLEKKLAKAQRKLSCKVKYSKNLYKQLARVQKIHQYPSSKLCWECNSRKLMSLQLRTYVCDECGRTKDHGYHASQNIKNRVLELALA